MADTTAGVAVLPSVAVRLSNRLGYDACADIVALLAFPKDEHKRLKFARAIRWQYVVQRARSEPEWHTDLPVSQFMPREHEDLDLLFKQGNKHLENRNGSPLAFFSPTVAVAGFYMRGSGRERARAMPPLLGGLGRTQRVRGRG